MRSGYARDEPPVMGVDAVECADVGAGAEHVAARVAPDLDVGEHVGERSEDGVGLQPVGLPRQAGTGPAL